MGSGSRAQLHCSLHDLTNLSVLTRLDILPNKLTKQKGETGIDQAQCVHAHIPQEKVKNNKKKHNIMQICCWNGPVSRACLSIFHFQGYSIVHRGTTKRTKPSSYHYLHLGLFQFFTNVR